MGACGGVGVGGPQRKAFSDPLFFNFPPLGRSQSGKQEDRQSCSFFAAEAAAAVSFSRVRMDERCEEKDSRMNAKN